MDMEHNFSRMAISIKANTWPESFMEKARIPGAMAPSTKVNSKTE